MQIAVIAEEGVYGSVYGDGSDDGIVFARPVNGSGMIQMSVGCPDGKIGVHGNQGDGRCSQFHKNNVLSLFYSFYIIHKFTANARVYGNFGRFGKFGADSVSFFRRNAISIFAVNRLTRIGGYGIIQMIPATDGT